MKVGGKRAAKRLKFQKEENRIAGMLNFLILLCVAAAGYTDWIVVSKVSLTYRYVLPIAHCGCVRASSINLLP